MKGTNFSGVVAVGLGLVLGWAGLGCSTGALDALLSDESLGVGAEAEDAALFGCSSRVAVPVPPLAQNEGTPDAPRYRLEAKAGRHTFHACNVANTWGYNGDYLGPTLRLRRNVRAEVQLRNGLDEATSLHWHGLVVPHGVDITAAGLAKGAEAAVTFAPQQPAGSFWYHPHEHMATGKQVYFGLAGLALVEDEVSDALALPKAYGVDDLPLVIQDRRFDADGELEYLTQSADKDGMLGDKVVVNGVLNGELEVPASLVRLRVLNGSNARPYLLALSNAQAFWQIASDGGFLAQPVRLESLMLAPGERAELLVDARSFGRRVSLVSEAFSGGGHNHAHLHSDTTAAAPPAIGSRMTLLRFKVVPAQAGAVFDVPQTLAALPAANASSASNAADPRPFALDDTGMAVINGKSYDGNRVDVVVRERDTEVWQISNAAMMAHPFHIHAAQFRVLERSTGPVPAQEKGFKDTVFVQPNERVKLLVSFETTPGKYLYHCHNLEHEDMGMMGTFEIR